MEVILIACVAKNGVIGRKDSLPWYIPEDLKHFKELTLNSPVIMGRKTYESIFRRLGKPLPDRINIVVSRQNLEIPGIIVCNSVEQAIKEAEKHGKKVYIIGGENVYQQTIELADKLEITRVDKNFEGDAFFPEIDGSWKEIKREDKIGELSYSFVTYVKNKLFITFEGIDGCGKSTQMKKFVEYLFVKNKYNHILITREPYKENNIRKILNEDLDPLSQAEKLLELFVNDRRKHAEEIIIPNVKKGIYVVSDRYKLSTIAYQSAQGIKFERLMEMHKDLPISDFTFVIDLPVSEAMKRMAKEDGRKTHKLETNLDFLEKVRMNFIKSKDLLNENIFIIDGNRDVESIFEDIIGAFESI